VTTEWLPPVNYFCWSSRASVWHSWTLPPVVVRAVLNSSVALNQGESVSWARNLVVRPRQGSSGGRSQRVRFCRTGQSDRVMVLGKHELSMNGAKDSPYKIASESSHSTSSQGDLLPTRCRLRRLAQRW
jgi:hypothetical protein